ncbi:Crp/Fnr family transcriptional regulator [Geomonas sp. RF6]|uniref:Crp/Fnr family transcriptional regulator n=1 Tax=Geomonas sp. RF6 TaxID=2897342 RepID=UPI001E545B14|nr:Crp/Fnr family transcriptional regulator [Geomonas sp. RF6]UFS68547.1 Crp/Fnr family transcriptional regulator [Geomonas sp. RF6]
MHGKMHQSPDLAEFTKEFKPRRLPRKTIIFSPTDEIDVVFMVKKGRLRVYLAFEDKEFTLAFLEPGDFFSTHTRAFVQSLEDTEILEVSTARFQQKATEIPAISLGMMRILGSLFRSSISIIEGLAFKDVHLRLVDFLVESAVQRGQAVEGGILVELGLSTEDIALLVGSTRQTISTFLNGLIKRGIIEKKDRRTLIIRDLEALRTWKDSEK